MLFECVFLGLLRVVVFRCAIIFYCFVLMLSIRSVTDVLMNLLCAYYVFKCVFFTCSCFSYTHQICFQWFSNVFLWILSLSSWFSSCRCLSYAFLKAFLMSCSRRFRCFSMLFVCVFIALPILLVCLSHVFSTACLVISVKNKKRLVGFSQRLQELFLL